MLIHCVTLRFTQAASPADIDAFTRAVAALPGLLDFPVRTRHGHDIGERPANADYAIVSEFETDEQAASYDRWFRAKVLEAMNSTKPRLAHDEAMSKVTAALEERRKRRANHSLD